MGEAASTAAGNEAMMMRIIQLGERTKEMGSAGSKPEDNRSDESVEEKKGLKVSSVRAESDQEGEFCDECGLRLGPCGC